MRGGPVRLRIVVEAPPKGVVFSLQDVDNAPVDARASDGNDLAFELELRCDLSSGRPNFLGPFARGDPTDRFVYIASGSQAGQTGACWDRRAKVKLAGVSADQAAQALKGGVLSARIPGRMRDGGPVCAGLAPLAGWSVELS